MPTAKHFDTCPPFPSDVPVANVPVISYALLQQNDIEASAQLFQALREYGFFILDLKTSKEGQALLKDAEAMFDLTNETLDLDKEILNQFPIQLPKRVFGYKSTGKLAAEEGFKDAVETYMFGQDEIFGKTPDPVPQPRTVDARRAQCQSFCLCSYEATSVILDCLDVSLGLPKGTLISLCPFDQPSATGVRLLRASPSALHEKQTVSAGAHTDIGVLTLVFNVVGGLQIQPMEDLKSGEDSWKYIRPRQGCVVVNVGDTLVQWTGGILRSSLHRVHKPPGEQAIVPRVSLAYPLRPARTGSMQRLKGSDIIPALADGEKDETRSTDDWAAWKAQQIRDGQYKPQTVGGISMAHFTPPIAV